MAKPSSEPLQLRDGVLSCVDHSMVNTHAGASAFAARRDLPLGVDSVLVSLSVIVATTKGASATGIA